MADKELVILTLERLETEFKRSFPPAGVKEIRKDLLAAPNKALDQSFDHFVLSGRFPSPQQLRDQVHHETKLIAAAEARERENEWDRTRGVKPGATDQQKAEQIKRTGSIFTTEQQDAHTKHAVQAIMLMLSDASREDKLQCFRVMDDQYPGVGWAHSGMLLQKDWAAKEKHAAERQRQGSSRQSPPCAYRDKGEG